MFNLEEPGEHPLCGDGLVSDEIGFSYDPELLSNAGIAYFNCYWQDLTLPDANTIKRICLQMDMFVKRGQRVLVHCHAGMGRTAIICASYLVYSGECQDGEEAVNLVKA